MNILVEFLSIISDVILNLAIAFAAILIPILLFNVLQKLFVTGIKNRPGLMLRLIGLLAVPIHELSHAFMCIIFKHKIDKVVLFNLTCSNKALGYVEHRYSPTSAFQLIGCFFIGIAPIFGGLFAISLLTIGMLDNGHQWLLELTSIGAALRIESPIDIILLSQSCFASTIQLITVEFNSNSLMTIFWFMLVASIGLYLSPSKADLQGSLKGFIVIIIGLVSIQCFTSTQLNFTFIEAMLIPLSTILTMTLCLSLALFVLTIAISTIISHLFTSKRN
ncbi:hypothetical protein [Shewanella aestuarii]|uniref:M50 family metallopeptidase n=1 Tax=Shewanella aestuarii TaxID=1028752 RepID=A0A6G9QQL3_9GAMM|nr:hypothetical protein [Shewanella aestuarii]QIR16355.1 hypothetical protein HBH39_17875 [Shewanella aestuarii]